MDPKLKAALNKLAELGRTHTRTINTMTRTNMAMFERLEALERSVKDAGIAVYKPKKEEK